MSRSRTLAGALALVATLFVALAPATSDAQTGGDPGRSLQWGLDKVKATTAWEVGRGDGVIIAIVDTGVDLRHEDLTAKLVPGRDFVDDDEDPSDANGHGTHVAGIAAAATSNGKGVAGTAPDARIMPIRVLDENGDGFSDDVLDGVRWAVDNGADVVNLSLGVTGAQLIGNALDGAVRYAWDRGVIPVVAAGNDYVLSSGFANEPAIVVAATTREDTKPDYSNGVGSARWGMAAPGGESTAIFGREDDEILSTWWNGQEPDLYAYQSGTSMAAPHVSGAAAMLLGLGLAPDEVVERLVDTARDIGPPGFDGTFGHGLLDLEAAVAGLGAPSTTPTTATPPVSTTPPPAADERTGATRRSPTTRRPTTSGSPSAYPDDAVATRVPSVDARGLDRSLDSRTGDVAQPSPGGDDPSRGLLALATVLVALTGGGAAVVARRR